MNVKLFFILLIPLFIVSCKSSPSEDDLIGDKDDMVYVSDDFLNESEDQVDDYEPVEENNTPSKINVPKSIKNYQRTDDSPEEFAKASLNHVIRMVYADPYSNPSVVVTNSKKENDQLQVSLKISWSDQWAGPYIISGLLTVNTDGSNAKFVINSKNAAAEALELTNEGYLNQKQLPVL